MLGRFDGERIELEEVRRFPTQSVRLPDGLYWNALGLYCELTAALSDVCARARTPRSVGIDSWGVDFGLLDAAGALLANPLSYRDGRGAEAMREALASGDTAEEIYATTGIQFLPINTLYQLLALSRPRASIAPRPLLLLMPGSARLLADRRTGAPRRPTRARPALDAPSGEWAERPDRAARAAHAHLPADRPAGIDPRRHPAPDCRRHGAAAGDADRRSWRRTTRPRPSSRRRSPARASAFISSGTWSLVGVELASAGAHARGAQGQPDERAGLRRRTRLLKNVMGLWLVQECRRAWLREGDAPEYPELAELAAGDAERRRLRPGRSRSCWLPGDMPARIRAACARAGQDVPGDAAGPDACDLRQPRLQVPPGAGADRGGDRHERSIRARDRGRLAATHFLCQLTANVTRRASWPGRPRRRRSGTCSCSCTRSASVASLEQMREIVAGARRTSAPSSPIPRPRRGTTLYARFQTVLDAEVRTR